MHALRLVNTSQVFNRRRSKRCALDRKTTGQVRADGSVHACIIEDISLGGARLLFQDAVPEGREMVLEHAIAGLFPGKIVWTEGNIGGFQFDGPQQPLERELQCVALMVGSDDTQPGRKPVP